VEPLTILLLCGFAFVAGFIDAIVGGGGLVQLPALLILLPGHSVATIFGTNKCSSIAGTAMATWRYSREVRIDWRVIAPAAVTAFVFAALGSRCVALLNPAVLRPLILALLIVVAIYVFLAKTTGLIHQPKHPHERARWFGLLTGAAIGFYDGFFGPGTGSFLIFIFVGFFGFDFLFASASAKVINLGTNLASVIYFAATDHILYRAALPMAACNVLGSYAGSRLAILKGSAFIRVFFLVMVGALIAKLAWDLK
jgi:uncharacterized membrane protein YfcA